MKKRPPTNQVSLALRQGEFEVFYNSHYDAISRYVARRVPPSSHDDLVAATFVIAWRKFATVPAPSLTWLYRIASYEVAHERRRLGRQPRVAELNDVHLIDATPLHDVFDISEAFSQMSESDTELLSLVFWDDLSRNEIAEILNLSVNVVNVRYHRALSRLTGTLHRLASASDTVKSGNHIPKENP
ncbi:MAG: sigma-70 family RNA polymerase sigma factor [Acidimicrobiales bacterium]